MRASSGSRGNQEPAQLRRSSIQRSLKLGHLRGKLGVLGRHFLGSRQVILKAVPGMVSLNDAIQLSRTPPQLPGKLLVSVDSRIPKLRLDSIMLIQQALYGLKHFQNLFRLLQV